MPATPLQPTQAGAPARGPRLDAIDALRGLVMVIMALDHTRDYFSNYAGDPLDVTTTTPAMFLTRWITHFCAPVFVFLAGTGAYLFGRRTSDPAALTRFLWTRGLWLIVLEATVVSVGWRFQFNLGFLVGQVIWALGASMILMSVLVRLPWAWIAGFAVLLIVGHNATDGIRFPADDWRHLPWSLLHSGDRVRLPGGVMFWPLYTVVPWVGVMAAGYAFGPLTTLDPSTRRKWLVTLGTAMLVAFAALRASNLYGEPSPWTSQPTPTQSILAFLNCSKYPPSLLYLLMTLGPMMFLLAAAEAFATRVPSWLVTFGRVPMFYYLLHLYVIHAGAGVAAFILGRPEHAVWVLTNPFFAETPTGYGYPLWGVYLAWVTIVALLYFPCRWYADLKKRSRHPLLSYL